ncbi:MAG: response regulator transcription factor [Chromatiales bacterium]
MPESEGRAVVAIGVASVCARWKGALPGAWGAVEVRNRDALMAAVRDHTPELGLVYLGLPQLRTEDVAVLHHLSPGTRLVAFADDPAECEARYLVKAGVRGYLPVTTMPHVVAKAVRVVLDGDLWVGRRTLLSLIEELQAGHAGDSDCRRAALGQLTPREGEIAERIAAGDSNRSIAARLRITERTVKAHLTAIFAKTGVHDRVHLALLINSL